CETAVPQPASPHEVMIVELDIDNFLAVAVNLKDPIAPSNERAAVTQPFDIDRLNDLLLPLDVALELALGDAIVVRLSDQHAIVADYVSIHWRRQVVNLPALLACRVQFDHPAIACLRVVLLDDNGVTQRPADSGTIGHADLVLILLPPRDP